jgi:hypothetical protein
MWAPEADLAEKDSRSSGEARGARARKLAWKRLLHPGIRSVDLRRVQAGLDDGDLALSGTMRRGTPPMAASARVFADRS